MIIEYLKLIMKWHDVETNVEILENEMPIVSEKNNTDEYVNFFIYTFFMSNPVQKFFWFFFTFPCTVELYDILKTRLISIDVLESIS